MKSALSINQLMCNLTASYSSLLQKLKFSSTGFITKVILVFIVTSSFFPLKSNAQTREHKSSIFKSLSPDYDHYKTFANLSPSSDWQGIDTLQFQEKDFKHDAYLKMNTVYIHLPVSVFKIKRFPANSSAQTRKELDFLKELQYKRTPEDILRTDTLASVYYDPFTINPYDQDYKRNNQSLFFVGRNLGTWFNPDKLPISTKVLQNVIQDATFYFFSLKVKFNRARPYQLDPTLKNLEAPGHASYPSGHSSASYVNALLLSRIFPELKEQFMSNAYDMAFSREIRGVHYPSDSKAGKEFAEQFIVELFKSNNFLKDFAAMKAEIKKVKKLNN